MKRTRLIRIAVFALICTSLWFYRYFSFNKKIADTYTPQRKYYNMNETVEYEENIINLHDYEGCSINLKKAQIMDVTDFCEHFPVKDYNEINEELNEFGGSKICLLTINFSNNSEIAIDFDVADVLLYGQDKPLYLSSAVIAVNPELSLEEKSTVHIISGGSQIILLPYIITNEGFSDKEWAQIEEYPLLLFVTQFPIEQVIRVEYS